MKLEAVPSTQADAGGQSFGETGLAPVYELNRFMLDVLIDVAARPAGESRSRLAVVLKGPLARLTEAGRDRLSRCPVSLVDAGFRDDPRWTAALGRPNSEFPANESAFPHLQALRLAHQTVTLAWTSARANLESACIIFGMSRRCAGIVARAGLQSMERVAERHPDWVRPAWENAPEIWHHLIAMAEQAPQPRLPLGLRALQRQLADFEPATRESGEIRSSRR
jgi:hypothetical protein